MEQPATQHLHTYAEVFCVSGIFDIDTAAFQLLESTTPSPRATDTVSAADDAGGAPRNASVQQGISKAVVSVTVDCWGVQLLYTDVKVLNRWLGRYYPWPVDLWC